MQSKNKKAKIGLSIPACVAIDDMKKRNFIKQNTAGSKATSRGV